MSVMKITLVFISNIPPLFDQVIIQYIYLLYRGNVGPVVVHSIGNQEVQTLHWPNMNFSGLKKMNLQGSIRPRCELKP